jgi:predicted HTH domain antitoxin
MKTEEIRFDIPEDILASLKSGIEDLKREIRSIAAITYYREKKLSLGKAAQLAGMNRLDFMDLLAEKRITIFDLDESAAKVEIESARKLS